MYRPDPETLPLLGAIIDLLPDAKPIKKQFTRPPRIIRRLDGGQLFYDSKLELDTDGWPEGRGRGDPSWQPGTSLNYPGGVAINANTVPYIVLPQPKAWTDNHGISLGDYAAVIYKNRISFAVFADRGPDEKIGEGSIELLRRLGEERIKPDGRIRNVGMGPNVITIVFPGSGAAAHRKNQSTLLANIERHGRRLFLKLGGTAPTT